MTSAEDRDLLRRLAGESPAGGARGGSAEVTGGHRAAGERNLAALWAALEPPPVESAPPGFAGRVMSRVGEAARRRSGVGRLLAAPGRLAAASALSAGLVAGAGLGMLVTPADRAPGRAATGSAVTEPAADRLSGTMESAGLAEEELLALAVEAAGGGRGADDPATGLAASFGADPDLVGGYLAALDALEGEPL